MNLETMKNVKDLQIVIKLAADLRKRAERVLKQLEKETKGK